MLSADCDGVIKIFRGDEAIRWVCILAMETLGRDPASSRQQTGPQRVSKLLSPRRESSERVRVW